MSDLPARPCHSLIRVHSPISSAGVGRHVPHAAVCRTQGAWSTRLSPVCTDWTEVYSTFVAAEITPLFSYPLSLPWQWIRLSDVKFSFELKLRRARWRGRNTGVSHEFPRVRLFICPRVHPFPPHASSVCRALCEPPKPCTMWPCFQGGYGNPSPTRLGRAGLWCRWAPSRSSLASARGTANRFIT